jgi:hypothetical protein
MNEPETGGLISFHAYLERADTETGELACSTCGEGEDSAYHLLAEPQPLERQFRAPAHKLPLGDVGSIVMVNSQWGYHDRGLWLMGEPGWQDVQEIVSTAEKIERASKFALGDILVYAENHYHDLWLQYTQMSETMRKVHWVCSQIPVGRRIQSSHLTFAHYDTVAALEPKIADALLRAAHDNLWTVKRLRQEAEPFRTTVQPVIELVSQPHGTPHCPQCGSPCPTCLEREE